MSWEFTFKKAGHKYSRRIPARVEARKYFRKDRDYSNVLLVAYADGNTTVSMNGTTHMDVTDIDDMARALSTAKHMIGDGSHA